MEKGTVLNYLTLIHLLHAGRTTITESDLSVGYTTIVTKSFSILK